MNHSKGPPIKGFAYLFIADFRRGDSGRRLDSPRIASASGDLNYELLY